MYEAEIVYDKAFREARFYGVMTSKQLQDRLIDFGMWDADSEDRMDEIVKQLESIKLRMFDDYMGIKDVGGLRKQIETLNSEWSELAQKRGKFSVYSAESLALLHKNQYVACIGCGLDYHDVCYELSVGLSECFLETLIPEEEVREIARTDPWKTFWRTASGANDIFGTSARLFTFSQRSLISWSKFYDSIGESPECPPEGVINDDDLLDGWLLAQANKRKQEEKQRQADKFGDHGEIFIPAQTLEEAARVDAYNTGSAKMAKRQKLGAVARAKTKINEEDLPASKKEMRMAAQKQLSNHLKNR
jgi:hypothetical protein